MKVVHTRNRAVAVLIVLMLISFMLVLVMATSNGLFSLKREIKLVDQQQKRRWAEVSTNSPPRAATVTNQLQEAKK